MIMQSSVKSTVSTPTSKAPAFRRSRLAAAIGMAGMMLVAGMSGSVLAAKGGTPGKPTNGGGGGAPDLGDLIVLHRDAWTMPPLFTWLQQHGNVADAEMHRVFNCGIGMVVIVAKENADAAIAQLKAAGETVSRIGEIRERQGAEAQTIVV